MAANINKSLYVPRINKFYDKDSIKNIFWKFNIGKVDRIDFVPIINVDSGIEDTTFQQAFIYMAESCSSWNFDLIQHNKKAGSYSLFPYRVPYKKYNNNDNNDNNDNNNDCLSLYNNKIPIPYSITNLNVHQLSHNNSILEEKIIKLEKEICYLNGKK